jgi:prepilin-type processing-associated H-X9-DG protein
MKRPSRRAVGLITTLVVVFGGLACLGAILFPVFASAEAAAKHTACLSNVKQSVTALLMYSSDSEDKMPPRDSWMDATLPYTMSENVWRCPEVDHWNATVFGYSYNSWLQFRKEEDVQEPYRTPCVYDSLNLARNASDPYLSRPPIRPAPPHYRRCNVGYLDGHAKLLIAP